MLVSAVRRLIAGGSGTTAGNLAAIPDGHVYKPFRGGRAVFHPWLIDPDIASLMNDLTTNGSHTLVDWDRMWTLKWALGQTKRLPGEIWELGVYRGGSALFFKRMTSNEPKRPIIRLFDSFEGLPLPTENVDRHAAGDFADTSLEEVRALLGDDTFIDYRKGWIPHTFGGLETSSIRAAHIDLDLYQPILDAIQFVYPRLIAGGVVVFDDYGFDSCPGARRAIDEYFRDTLEVPLALPTGQAVVVKRQDCIA